MKLNSKNKWVIMKKESLGLYQNNYRMLDLYRKYKKLAVFKSLTNSGEWMLNKVFKMLEIKSEISLLIFKNLTNKWNKQILVIFFMV
jgi:hypothetical protein